MSKQKKRRTHAEKQPQAAPYAAMPPRRQRIHRRADEISALFAKREKLLNRLLLGVFAVVVVLWLAGALAGSTARYLIVAIMGAALALNGLSGYRQSRWAGFSLMVFGTLLFLGNLFMLTR